VSRNSESPAGVNDRAGSALAQLPTALGNGHLSLRNRTRDSVLAVRVVVANTYVPRLIGLLGQSANWASESRGLWIIPCHGVHTLGMRFAIDVLFLDRYRTVVYTHENLQPWRISRVISGSRSVLELPAGTIARSQTQVGDQIEPIRL
jgi:uncharacterized protein